MFVDNRDLTREERTEAASDFLTKGRDSDTIRAVVVLTNEVSTLRDFVRELEKERNCAKCHVEDSEFCDEVNAALACNLSDRDRRAVDIDVRASSCPFWQEYDGMVTSCSIDDSLNCPEGGRAPAKCPLRSGGILVTRNDKPTKTVPCRRFRVVKPLEDFFDKGDVMIETYPGSHLFRRSDMPPGDTGFDIRLLENNPLSKSRENRLHEFWEPIMGPEIPSEVERPSDGMGD